MHLVLGHYGHRGGGLFLGWLFFLLVVGGLVALGVWAVSRFGGRGGVAPAQPAAAGPDPALATLRLRYARGELSREEFLRTSADLGAPPPADEPPAA
jgi:uncharacterized membrane protein